MELYLPQKYPVLLGKGLGAGLCTCWSAPEMLTKLDPKLLETFAAIGTLYSKEGVSVILRNLCLNPQIRELYVLADNPLSQTPFGEAGWKNLFALWQNGIGDDGVIQGTATNIHKEIDPTVVRTVLKNVTLHDASGWSRQDLLAHAAKTASKPYMESISFPEPKRDASKPFPSERIGWTVRSQSIVGAWLSVVERILRYGLVTDTEYGSKQRELHVITWVIEGDSTDDVKIPDWPQHVLERVGLAGGIPEYADSLRRPQRASGTHYTYGERLHDYHNFDQVESMIAQLNKTPYSRRAFATIPIIPHDLSTKSPPCLVFLHAFTEEGKVHLAVVFRSHDFGKAAIPNAYALLGLLEHIAKETGFPRGSLAITSNSAHLYEEDWEEMRKTVTCERWAEPQRRFSVESLADARGNVRIYANDGVITLEFVTREGDVLQTLTGKAARPILIQLTTLDLLSQPYHYADIAIELTKAEIALKAGLQYTQDKHLVFHGTPIN